MCCDCRPPPPCQFLLHRSAVPPLSQRKQTGPAFYTFPQISHLTIFAPRIFRTGGTVSSTLFSSRAFHSSFNRPDFPPRLSSTPASYPDQQPRRSTTKIPIPAFNLPRLFYPGSHESHHHQPTRRQQWTSKPKPHPRPPATPVPKTRTRTRTSSLPGAPPTSTAPVP